MSKDELEKDVVEESLEESEEETLRDATEEDAAEEVADDEEIEEPETSSEDASEDENDEDEAEEDGEPVSDDEDESDEETDESDDVVTEKEGNENDIVESDEEGEDEEVEEENKEKKSPLLIAIFVVLVITIVILLVQRLGGSSIDAGDQSAAVLGELTTYNNPVHGFTLEYPDTFQLIATDNIPAELAAQGISSMEMMGLSDGDALLVQEDSATDNIVYTILALSNQPLFTTTEEYVADLKANLEESGDEFNFEYAEREVAIGEQEIEAFEFSFEMEVPGADGLSVRQGAFYDTIFEYDGTTYSVSFGYPKDSDGSAAYLDAYEAILSSIDFSEGVSEEVES